MFILVVGERDISGSSLRTGIEARGHCAENNPIGLAYAHSAVYFLSVIVIGILQKSGYVWLVSENSTFKKGNTHPKVFFLENRASLRDESYWTFTCDGRLTSESICIGLPQ